MLKKLTLSVVVAVGILVPSMSNAGDNLVKNAGLTELNSSGKLAHWYAERNAKVEDVDGKKTLVLTGAQAMIMQKLKVKPEWKYVTLSIKMKVTDVRKGDANWKSARFGITFKNANGKRVGRWPSVLSKSGTTQWKSLSKKYKLPEGTSFIELMPCNFGVSGKVEFQDIKLVVSE